MNDDRGAQIESLFHEAVALPESERQQFLRARCGGDSELLKQVETLIRRDQLKTALPAAPLHRQRGVAALAPETVIGRYRIVRLIAEGGFGEVYLAQQSQPVQRSVALKVLKPGMDSRDVVRRFEAERQALAMMDHPGIAQIFDSGATDEGRPYFVMEYVPGVPIDAFCDVERIELADRLRLFVDICRAVHHAHQKGVIHRDLKPSNILVQFVDGRPAAKVIDFGIAKAVGGGLSTGTIATVQGSFIGTPEYMSPEQAEASGLNVDTRTDVYSLGVMLYQLLVGVLPIDSSSLRGGSMLELPRAIRTMDPARPSTRLRALATRTGRVGAESKSAPARAGATEAAADVEKIASCRRTTPQGLIRHVRGDLDWITMKALEKERSRRYDSANEFALDIERHFRNEPVTAGPPTVTYRMRKFVTRNKMLVTAASVVGLVLLLGVIGTTTQWMRAQREAAMASAVNEFMTDIIVAPLPAWDLSTPGSDMPAGPELTLTDAIRNSLPAIDQTFADYPIAEARVRLAIGKSFIALSRFEEAESQLRRALELHQSLYGERDQRTWDAMAHLGTALEFLGQFDESHELTRRVVQLSEQSLGPEHPTTLRYALMLATALMDKYDHAAEAATLSRNAYEVYRRTQGERHWSAIHAKSILSFALHMDFHSTVALALAEEAMADLQSRGELETGLGALVLLVIGNCHNDLQDPETALHYYEQALAVGLEVYGDDSFMTGTVHQLIAMAHLRLGDWENARRMATVAYETQLGNLGENHPYTQTSRLRVLVSQVALGKGGEQAMRDLGRFFTEPTQPLLYETFLAVDALILYLLEDGRRDEAQQIGRVIEPLIDVGLASREVGLGPEGARAFAVQGLLALDAGNHEAASARLSRAREMWSTFLPHLLFPPEFLLAHGTAEFHLGRAEAARTLLNEALRIAEEQGREEIAEAARAQIKLIDTAEGAGAHVPTSQGSRSPVAEMRTRPHAEARRRSSLWSMCPIASASTGMEKHAPWA